MAGLKPAKAPPSSKWKSSIGSGNAFKCGCPLFLRWKKKRTPGILLSCPHLLDLALTHTELPLAPDAMDWALIPLREEARSSLLCPEGETLPGLLVVSVLIGADEDGFMNLMWGGDTVAYVTADTSRLDLGAIVGPYMVAYGSTRCSSCEQLPISDHNLAALLYRAAFMERKGQCPSCYSDDLVPD